MYSLKNDDYNILLFFPISERPHHSLGALTSQNIHHLKTLSSVRVDLNGWRNQYEDHDFPTLAM